jgi:uncharacterized membrane-anchored protein
MNDVNIQVNVSKKVKRKQILLRVNPDVDIWLQNTAQKHNLSKSALLNLILDSLKSGSLIADIIDFIK